MKIKLNKQLLIIVILLITIGVLYFRNQDSKYSLIEYQSVPRIKIVNLLDYSSDDNLFHGCAKGFVAFNNINNQPHGLTPYYIIEPLNKFDEKSNQIFSVETIVAFNNLSPESIGKDEVFEKNNSLSTLTLEDEYGNLFFINKITKEVSMRDATGDETRLITSNSAYRTFMWDFLSK